MNRQESYNLIKANIFDRLFPVKVPYIHTRSIAHIKLFGINNSGIKSVDKSVAQMPTLVQIPIIKMVDHYKNGVTVAVTRESDISAIYKYVSDFINYWQETVRYGLNIDPAIIDELIYLDEFATTVHRHAKYIVDEAWVSNAFAEGINSVMDVNASTILAPLAPDLPKNAVYSNGAIQINGSVPDVPDRDSLAQFFRERLIHIRSGRI